MTFIDGIIHSQVDRTRSEPTASPRLGPTPTRKVKRLSLALQGGGAFGAFTWGVLDRLLEEESIAFDAVSGASAGAMNAVLLASGLAQGGRETARASLERFWRKVRGWSAKPPCFVERSPQCNRAAAFTLSVQSL